MFIFLPKWTEKGKFEPWSTTKEKLRAFPEIIFKTGLGSCLSLISCFITLESEKMFKNMILKVQIVILKKKEYKLLSNSMVEDFFLLIFCSVFFYLSSNGTSRSNYGDGLWAIPSFSTWLNNSSSRPRRRRWLCWAMNASPKCRSAILCLQGKPT